MDVKSTHKQGYCGASIKDHRSATLLICRRMIELAFADALQCDSRGHPTERALESWEWISAKTDWTIYGKQAPPPPELRSEYPGTFDWCVQWLGENPDHVRDAGLPEFIPFVHVEGRQHRDHIKGLPDVKRRWQIAASRHSAY